MDTCLLAFAVECNVDVCSMYSASLCSYFYSSYFYSSPDRCPFRARSIRAWPIASRNTLFGGQAIREQAVPSDSHSPGDVNAAHACAADVNAADVNAAHACAAHACAADVSAAHACAANSNAVSDDRFAE
jgi:hypothetical protein